MEEIKDRKCIICLKELPIDRELTCCKECAKRYDKLGRKIVSILNKKTKNICIICGKELELEYKKVCNSCMDLYLRIKNHFLILKDENNISTKSNNSP